MQPAITPFATFIGPLDPVTNTVLHWHGIDDETIVAKRMLPLEELQQAALAAKTYAGARFISMDWVEDLENLPSYFTFTSVGQYLLTDDTCATFQVSHRKSDDKWSLKTENHGWINQEYVTRKLAA